RGMKTMGIDQLTLVNPARFPDPQADWRAAGAADVLDRTVVVGSVAEAISDCHCVVGTSTRSRHIPWPVVLAKDIAACLAEQPPEASIAILFGREDSGLTNEELQLCQCHLQIPSSPIYGSLNLAMAVQVVAYELYQFVEAQEQSSKDTASNPSASPITNGAQRIWDRPPATQQQFESLMTHLQQTLVKSGFVDPEAPGHTLTRLRRMLARHQLDETEVQILRGVLKHLNSRLDSSSKPPN
ncbi:MAG: TrmJ/YjtD family RNA methyltransferase, partial [Proteobacteria bacterium]|nr:TrmJ/YjtD family RNA methyltransferase [Pseudomonadota bacterium]